MPKFALASVTNNVPPSPLSLNPPPLDIRRLVDIALRCATRVQQRRRNRTLRPSHPRHSSRSPVLSDHVTYPHHSGVQSRAFVRHLPLPARGSASPPRAAKPHGFSFSRRVDPSSFAPSSVSKTPNASQCCQIRERAFQAARARARPTVISRNTFCDSQDRKSVCESRLVYRPTSRTLGRFQTARISASLIQWDLSSGNFASGNRSERGVSVWMF